MPVRPPRARRPTVEAVREWLAAAISRRTGIPPAEVNASQPFRYYGFDSARVVEMVGDFSAWLGRPLPPTLLLGLPDHRARSRGTSARRLPLRRPAHARARGRQTAVRAAREPIAIIGMGCRFQARPT